METMVATWLFEGLGLNCGEELSGSLTDDKKTIPEYTHISFLANHYLENEKKFLVHFQTLLIVELD